MEKQKTPKKIKGPLTVETLREILNDDTLTDEQVAETLMYVNQLIDLIIDYQLEQELKNKNEQ